MLRDLQQAADTSTAAKADVAVVGAGIAGLLLASRLARRGVSVLVLESGAKDSPDDDDHPLNAVVHAGQPYRGATHGRSRGLGGTSRRWGGAMLPFLPCDMGEHTAGWPIDWPVAYRDVKPEFRQIEQIFELPGGPYENNSPNIAAAAHGDFILRSAKWPAFRLRNVAHTLANDIQGAGIEVWLNATVTRFAIGENGRVQHVTAASPSGNRLEVEAGIFVIAAGAIESTRLLLALDAQHDERIFAADRQLGRYFYDHLSTAAATILPAQKAALNRTFGLRFEKKGMRDLRIEPSPSLRLEKRLPAAFAHVAAVSTAESGFAALRGIYRAIQGRNGIDWRQAVGVARDLPWLFQAAWWRLSSGRLLYPRGSRFDLALVIEQMPIESSTIRLADNDCDSFGVRRARIDWRTSAEDLDAFASLQSHLCTWWEQSPFALIGKLEPTRREKWQQRLQLDSDVFHPGGTTRMGRSAADGVVDKDLKTFRVDNLYVVSTSTFPTGGGANPTFMLMAFALRVAEHIAGLRNSQGSRRNVAAAAAPPDHSAKALTFNEANPIATRGPRGDD